MIYSQGKCEDCSKLDECNKPVGIMFGFCNTDFEPKTKSESEDKHEQSC